MRKIIFPLLLVVIVLFACNHNQEEVAIKESPLQKSTTITLSIKPDAKDQLILTDDKGLKSSAITYTSVVSQGDIICWRINENSNIKSIEDIIIVTSDCGDDLFENGVIFNEDKTSCYAVISKKAFGKTKYDIKYKCLDGSVVLVDPEVDVVPPDRSK